MNLRAQVYLELETYTRNLTKKGEYLKRKKGNYWAKWTAGKLKLCASMLNRILLFRASDEVVETKLCEVIKILSAVSVELKNVDEELGLLTAALSLQCLNLLPQGTEVQLKLWVE